ncbi:MKI67 FHA domain-interacting nucleolar phosphoprotein [Scaptodrosophila lebanonensis]|uniref:MKI67 FHA domain-interacting nucleolar phosphoprotein n=1 Tax=Drosophila lebanonensis TaxID=7225 RepID=A0A6J2T7D2_DROLE|nr:MKI67 FHA domain-interacting nucleolar phosphoprotein [Scaptodrosophila lebanonensis]
MPPVKKPKPQNIKQASPTKKVDETKDVVSGQLKKKMQKAKKRPVEKLKRGIVLVKHLPHGFFEDQLRKYFQQFGRVTRLRLARSRRTGGSKGFAFVEFEYPEVAKVAADTMDNYLMFQKVVKAAYIPPEEQKFNYFKTSVRQVTNNAGKKIFVSNKTKSILRRKDAQNNWDESASQKRITKGLAKLKKFQKEYEHLGIDFSGVLIKPEKKSKQSNVPVAKSTKAEATSDTTTVAKVSKSTKKAESKKDLNLSALLGNTLNEDSDDEDYEQVPSSNESEEELEFLESDDSDDDDEEDLQLEDLLGNSLDEDSMDEDYEESINDDDVEEESFEAEKSDTDSDEEEELSPPPKKTQKKLIGVDRQLELIKRRPGTGGIQKKKNIIAPAKPTKKAATKTLQLADAKKQAKSLNKIKTKKLKK